MTPEEEALECISRHLFNLTELLRTVDTHAREQD